MKKIFAKSLALLTLAFGYVSCMTTSDVSSIVDKAVEKQNKVMTQMKDDYQDKFHKIKGDYQDRIKQLKSEHEKELEKMKKNSNADFEKMKANSDANFEKMKKNYDGKVEQILEDLKKPENKGYDNSSAQLTDKTIDQMLDSVYEVIVDSAYRHTDGFLAEPTSKGSAFIVENKNGKQYFISCNHVVDVSDLMKRVHEAEKYKFEGRRIIAKNDKKLFLLDLLRQNENKDIAVLVSQTDLKIEKKIDFADKELGKGDVIYAVGYPVGYTRTGKTSLGKLMMQGTVLGPGTSDLKDYIYVGCALNSGISGGPLYVLENGVPKFAGVAARIVGAREVYAAVHYKHAKVELDKAIKDYESRPVRPQIQPKSQTQPKKQPQTQTQPKKMIEER